MNDIKKGLLVAGVFSAESPDKAGEIIDIAGMDISSLNDGSAILNAEHDNGKFSSYLGRIVGAKKIFKQEDCKTEHERKCFESVGKIPLIYGRAELFDSEEGHTEAKHAAAVIKAFKKKNLPIVAKFSIEGASIEKEGNLIKRSVARRCALTVVPANAACESEVLSELTKSEQSTYSEITKNSKTKGITTDLLVIDQNDIMKSLDNLQNVFSKLQKALEAGMPAGTASTQGGALQGTPKKKKEETTLPGEETTREPEEENKLKAVDKEKLDSIDEKAKEELNTKNIKFKKAEIFILKALTNLQK